MNVCDEVNDVLQRLQLFLGPDSKFINRHLPLDSSDHATPVRAISRGIVAAIPFGQVDVMPSGSCGGPMFVSPCRYGRKGGARFQRKQALNFDPGGWVEIVSVVT